MKKTRSSRSHRVGHGGPYATTPRTLPSLGVFSFVLSALPSLFNNLVHTLTRKFEFVRNKTKRFSAAVQIKNLEISIRVRLRAWSKRAPLPSWNTFKFLYSFRGKLSLAAPLPEVANPRTQRKSVGAQVLHVSGGDIAMSLPRGELVYCCKGEIKTCYVVHARNNNTTSSERTDVWAPFLKNTL